MLRFLFYPVSLLFFAGLFASCQKSDEAKSLRIGMDLSYPPFEMLDAKGKPAGISVEIAEALANSLQRPAKIVPMDFSGLIPALKSGNIDLIISSLTATEERRQSIDFSDPYAFIGLALLVQKDSEIDSIKSFKAKAKVLAVKAGTTGETWAMQNLPQARRVVFEDLSACVMEVAQGRADAFLYDQLTVYHYARKNPATTRAILAPLNEESWSIGIAKNRPELLEPINHFLQDFQSEGKLIELGDKYLADEKKAFRKAGIPFVLR